LNYSGREPSANRKCSISILSLLYQYIRGIALTARLNDYRVDRAVITPFLPHSCRGLPHSNQAISGRIEASSPGSSQAPTLAFRPRSTQLLRPRSSIEPPPSYSSPGAAPARPSATKSIAGPSPGGLFRSLRPAKARKLRPARAPRPSAGGGPSGEAFSRDELCGAPPGGELERACALRGGSLRPARGARSLPGAASRRRLSRALAGGGPREPCRVRGFKRPEGRAVAPGRVRGFPGARRGEGFEYPEAGRTWSLEG
jgi:hypothetical protein